MIAAFAGIEQGSIPEILIFAVVSIVSTCFQRIAGLAGVVHSDPNDRSDYMEPRLTCRGYQSGLSVADSIASFKQMTGEN